MTLAYLTSIILFNSSIGFMTILANQCQYIIKFLRISYPPNLVEMYKNQRYRWIDN